MKSNFEKNDNPKKITFIIGSMGKGGAERVISILANHYANKDWEVNILMMLEGKCDYDLNPKINLIPITQKDKSRILQLPFWIKEIRRHAKTVKPDRIVAFIARINLITLISCIGLNRDIIISERNDPKLDGRSIFVKYATYALYPLSKRTIFQTKWAQSCFPKRVRKKSSIIHNPVSVSTYSKGINSKKIVTIGRLSEQKNHSLLIDAFFRVNKIYPEYSLHIYGEGDLKDLLIKKIKDYGLDDKVVLEGVVSNIHEEISDSEMFVLSSNYEGLSNALLESMMMGIPCISTNCAGSNEVLKDGVTGLIVPVSDLDALANAIIKLIEDKQFADELAKNASYEAKQFSRDKILNQWEKVIEDGF